MVHHPCEYCHKEVYSSAGQRAHNKEYPRYCAEHNMCHTNWHGHVRRFQHTSCNILGCPTKPQFSNNNEFLRHFNRMHAGKGGTVEEARYDENNYDGYESDYAK